MYTAKKLDQLDLIEIFFALENEKQDYERIILENYERIADEQNEKLKTNYKKLIQYYKKRITDLQALQNKIRVE